MFWSSLTNRFFIKRWNISFVLFSHFWFLLQRFTSLAQITLILKEVASCWNNMVWIQFYHLSIWSYLLRKTVISKFASALVLSRWNIDGKTLIRQIRIVRPGSKLHIIMFSIAVNRHHALTVFIWILSVAWTSNGHWVIFFLIEVRNVHLSILRLIDWLSPIVSALGSRCTQSLILTNFKWIWNYLNWLLSLVISSIHLARLTLIRMGVMRWHLTFI